MEPAELLTWGEILFGLGVTLVVGVIAGLLGKVYERIHYKTRNKTW